MDTFSLFVERGIGQLCVNAVISYIIPMPFLSNDAMTGLQSYMLDRCGKIKCSSYAVRPQPVFENAVVDTTIIAAIKTNTKCESLLNTKMYRKRDGVGLDELVRNLQFTNVVDLCLRGRIPKIGTEIERSVLTKVLKGDTLSIGSLLKDEGGSVFYRIAGGRYFKVVTNYSTGSTQEREVFFERKISNAIGCILSSTLSFWFLQIYGDNHHWKGYEFESFRVPKLSKENVDKLNEIYKRYLKDIEKNANTRTSSEKSTYNVDSFKEYKIGYSKKIIDEIDDFIGPLYGLTKEEVEFIKNYELEFRMADYLTPEELEKIRGRSSSKRVSNRAGSQKANEPSAARTPSAMPDDEVLE